MSHALLVILRFSMPYSLPRHVAVSSMSTMSIRRDTTESRKKTYQCLDARTNRDMVVLWSLSRLRWSWSWFNRSSLSAVDRLDTTCARLGRPLSQPNLSSTTMSGHTSTTPPPTHRVADELPKTQTPARHPSVAGLRSIKSTPLKSDGTSSRGRFITVSTGASSIQSMTPQLPKADWDETIVKQILSVPAGDCAPRRFKADAKLWEVVQKRMVEESLSIKKWKAWEI
ncbi:hypothetical protein BDY19DRAFT_710414 [Irpex rosettiformis]|uniref:Uncharacterized protein n=1 Tax=Irpex rosettiformis TaxID=378272 RepID=A0ACB8TMP9_9APHY|nr:hypothetical protein BDY19DRAFT_710414 [Irpex rosettiformis]